MSSFTLFDSPSAMIYDKEASVALGKDYWRTAHAFRYYIGALGSARWVDVPAGFLSDGASVFFPVNTLIPAWGSYGQATVLHDYLCERYMCTRIRDGVVSVETIDRKEIDEIFDEAMKVLGVEKWRHKLIMAGVTAYRLATNPKRPIVNALKWELEKRKF